jgi:uncharacterized protein (DUF2249 family)
MDPDDIPSEVRALDVRELDEPPFAPIVDALEELAPGETLLLVNSFEPEPLYDVLSERGFTYETEQVGPAEWHVAIRHASP